MQPARPGEGYVRAAAGAYFLASDSVLDLAVAFLGSFRKFNPDLPLCLVPFDRKIEKLRRLRKRYGFQIFEPVAVLRRCDRISEQIHGQPTGEYRKLAMWEGPFETFVYFDIDTIVLASARFAFRFLRSYDFIASQSHIPESTQYVWKPSIRKSGVLTQKQIRYSASTGFIASKKSILSLEDAEAAATKAAAVVPHMALSYKEQPFLNFLVVTSDLHYTSLVMLAAQHPDLRIPIEKWAGGGLARVTRRELNLQRRRILFLHWAGMWKQRMHEESPIWRYYRNLSIGRPRGRSPRGRLG